MKDFDRAVVVIILFFYLYLLGISVFKLYPSGNTGDEVFNVRSVKHVMNCTILKTSVGDRVYVGTYTFQVNSTYHIYWRRIPPKNPWASGAACPKEIIKVVGP